MERVKSIYPSVKVVCRRLNMYLWLQERSVVGEVEVEKQKWCCMVYNGNMEEYHQENRSRTPEIDIYTETWTSTLFGKAQNDGGDDGDR